LKFFYRRIFGAHGNDLMGGEQFPDSELNLKEDYESENFINALIGTLLHQITILSQIMILTIIMMMIIIVK
jgi:hypothetical protein